MNNFYKIYKIEGNNDMNDNKLRKLSRSELIEIIYQYQLNLEELENENKQLKKELEDKRIRIKNAGNLADAVLEINNVMEAAQNAANMYLDEIKLMKKETEIECFHILKMTKEKAEEYLIHAKEKYENQ